MTDIEQARFNPLYESMLRALKLQGMAKATISAYSRRFAVPQNSLTAAQMI